MNRALVIGLPAALAFVVIVALMLGGRKPPEQNNTPEPPPVQPDNPKPPGDPDPVKKDPDPVPDPPPDPVEDPAPKVERPPGTGLGKRMEAYPDVVLAKSLSKVDDLYRTYLLALEKGDAKQVADAVGILLEEMHEVNEILKKAASTEEEIEVERRKRDEMTDPEMRWEIGENVRWLEQDFADSAGCIRSGASGEIRERVVEALRIGDEHYRQAYEGKVELLASGGANFRLAFETFAGLVLARIK
ncbi:MAG: hypothetical protein ACYTAF_16775 [Planctomycetota bacterium]|jgi:hypothetical protein